MTARTKAQKQIICSLHIKKLVVIIFHVTLFVKGKLTLALLPNYKPPLNEEISVLVAYEANLHIHVRDVYCKFYEGLHSDIQIYCQAEDAPYNPCVGELCLVKFGE